jgi:acetylornithine deacetylase/succinyl-diaminopimelate desuccinylase-like protein
MPSPLLRLPARVRSRLLGAYRAARLHLQQPRAVPRTIAPPAVSPAFPSGKGEFDADRAWTLLEAQCALGPRFPGSEGHRRCREWLVEQLGACADEVAVQEWDQKVARGPGAGRIFRLANVFAVFRGRGELTLPPEALRPEVMLSAHWDTRPVADQDPDPARRGDPVPGANDGASGVAVLLELARLLAAERPARTVVLAFWDGEDFGEYWYGSRLFARWLRLPEMARWRARRGVLVDMVGGRGLRCVTEVNSLHHAPALWQGVHASAQALGLGAHFGGPAMRINDDHVFLNRAGIPTVLLIGYQYPPWHTTHDTAEHCAPASLEVVGRVLEHWLRTDAGGGS